MNEAIYIWLYLSLGKILHPAVVYLTLIITPFIMFMSGMVLTDDPTRSLVRTVKNFPRKTAIVWILLCCIYPSTEDLKYIIGGALVINGVEAAKDIEGVSELPANMVGAMNHFLESVTEEGDK